MREASYGHSTMGLFARLPEGLAEQFPSLGDADPSPPHLTFLVLGEKPSRPSELRRAVRIVRREVARMPAFEATLRELDFFVSPHGTVIPHVRVHTDPDMAEWRLGLASSLRDAGIDVDDRFLDDFRPHVTLAYLGEDPVEWDGVSIPEGAWNVTHLELWGLPGRSPSVRLRP